MKPFSLYLEFGDEQETLLANIELFRISNNNCELSDAVYGILKRYFKLSYRQREQLEQKIFWENHRNKGFRSLPQFLKEKSTPKRLRKPKQATQPKPKKQTKKAEVA